MKNEDILAKKNKVLHRKNRELANYIHRLETELDIANGLIEDLRTAVHNKEGEVLKLKSEYVELLNVWSKCNREIRRLNEELEKRNDAADLLRIILNNDPEVL